MIQAMCGLMSVTGEPDDKPGGCPEKVGVPIVDIMSGMYATIAVLAALARRSETGRGDFIDIAMLDVGTACLANQAMNYLVSGKVPQRTGNAHPNIQPQDVFGTRDGHMVLVVGNDGQFGKACEVLGHAEWSKDDRFARNAGRVRNRAQLTTLIGEVLRERDTGDWVVRLEAAGVPCGPINSVPQVFANAQVRHRGMLVDIPHPLAGTVAQVVSPMRFSEAPLAFERAPPLLGEHTADILRELGIEEAQGAA
jgi:crotonobetainyl-CoA:carnitine CoA-transferase CaiB-like acyl-CoA transferase